MGVDAIHALAGPYVSGGFFVCAKGKRGTWNDPAIVPAELYSGSVEFCPRVPDAWAIEWANCTWEERVTEAHRFGISREDLPAVIRWTTEAMDQERFGWPSVFFRAEEAQGFVSRFLRPEANVALLELRVHEGDVAVFLETEATLLRQLGPGGHYIAVSRKCPGLGGEILGFDVLGMEANCFHSWLCNGIEGRLLRSLDIRANDFGLFASERDARIVANSYDDDENSGAEPVLWRAWLMARHALWEK